MLNVAPKNNQLTALNLEGNYLDQNNANDVLATVAVIPRIKELDLSDNQIDRKSFFKENEHISKNRPDLAIKIRRDYVLRERNEDEQGSELDDELDLYRENQADLYYGKYETDVDKRKDLKQKELDILDYVDEKVKQYEALKQPLEQHESVQLINSLIQQEEHTIEQRWKLTFALNLQVKINFNINFQKIYEKIKELQEIIDAMHSDVYRKIL